MRLFDTRYVHVMHMTYPDGTREDITITGSDLDDFGKKLFMAGFNFALAHPELQPRNT